jgi:hypothetical protein
VKLRFGNARTNVIADGTLRGGAMQVVFDSRASSPAMGLPAGGAGTLPGAALSPLLQAVSTRNNKTANPDFSCLMADPHAGIYAGRRSTASGSRFAAPI